MKSIYEQFKVARRAVVPLVGIETPDAFGTEAELMAGLNESGKFKSIPVIRWTAVTGADGLNDAGKKALQDAAQGQDIMSVTTNPIEAMVLFNVLRSRDCVIFAHGLHRYMLGFGQSRDAQVCTVTQGVQNLRDTFKRTGGMLVILASSLSFPSEVTADFVIFSQPLPTEDQLKAKLEQMIAANASAMDGDVTPDELQRAVFAVRGLTMFAAEQAYAMNLRKAGIDIEGLWDTKRKMISSTPGLTLWEGSEKLTDIRGNEAVTDFARALVSGKRKPGCVVFIDEIEKGLSGATAGTSDSSGVSQGFLGAMLEYIEDTDSIGLMCVGVPGAGKSLLAKAIGAFAQIPTIQFDLKSMRDRFVGSSEGRIREAFRVVSAVGGGDALFIATSNDISKLPPELLRRFSMGTYFFDLPSVTEQRQMWEMYIAKFGLNEPIPDESLWKGWTGAEIKACCNKADRTGRPLSYCASTMVPVAVSGKEMIDRLRKEASGRYLSSAYEGAYRGPADEADEVKAQPRGRKVRLED